jgi:hypothetical protein
VTLPPRWKLTRDFPGRRSTAAPEALHTEGYRIMKMLLFGRHLGLASDSLESTGGVPRRKFLVGLGLVAGTMIVKPVRALPGLAYDSSGWKESVGRLVSHICEEPAAGRIRGAIYSADTYYAAPQTDFHSTFSSRVIIDAQIDPEATYGDRYFELASLPYYDSRNPCRRTKDLNVLEIERILNGDEQDYYGGVVSPCSERRRLASCGCERNVYNKTLAHHNEDPAAWEPVYTRNFTDGRRSYLGFAIKPRADARVQMPTRLLISPDSV